MELNAKRIFKPFILLLFICATACEQDKPKSELEQSVEDNTGVFNKSRWSAKEGDDYIYRDQMLEDLVYNVQLKQLDVKEIESLLGRPDRIDSSFYFYRIRDANLFTLTPGTKTLVLKFDTEGCVEWRKIHGGR